MPREIAPPLAARSPLHPHSSKMTGPSNAPAPNQSTSCCSRVFLLPVTLLDWLLTSVE
jgi:hypothetical protein